MKGESKLKSLTKFSTLCLILVAFLAFIVPSAQATEPSAIAEVRFQGFYNDIEATTTFPTKEEDEEAYTIAAGALGQDATGKAVELVQEVKGTAVRILGDLPQGDRVVFLKMQYTPDIFTGDGDKTVDDLHLQYYDKDHATWLPYTFKVGKGGLAISGLNTANSFLVFNEGEALEYITETQEGKDSLSSTTILKSGQTYDIYYAVPTAESQQAVEPQTKKTLDDKSRLIAPEDRKSTLSDFISKDFQIDASLQSASAINLLQENTEETVLDDLTTNLIDAGWLNNRTPVGGLEEVNSNQSLALTTDLSGTNYTGSKFVTYAVQFRTPKSPNDNIPAIQEESLTAQNAVKIRRFSNLVNFTDEAVSTTFVENPTNESAWIVGPIDEKGEVDSRSAVSKLEYDKSYIVYYTVRLENGIATSSVCVLTRTASFSSDVNDPIYEDFFPMNSVYGQAGVSTNEGLQVVEAPNTINTSSGYEETNLRIKYEPDPYGNTDAIVSFKLTGFETAEGDDNRDAFIFSRKFRYELEENTIGGEITPSSIRLQKWLDAETRADDDFSYVNMYAQGVEGEAAKKVAQGTALEPAEVKALDGKFWLIGPDGAFIDARAATEERKHYTSGDYTVYFVVKDEGDFDTAKGELGTIADPNGLYPHAVIARITGCSVGNSSAYDMLILFFASLGLIALRVRSRKG